MAQCQYCMLQNKKNEYVLTTTFTQYKKDMRREIARLQTNDVALIELVEELQQRLKQAQDRIKELQNWVLNSYVSHNGTRYVNSSVTLKTSDADITQRFTPYDLYRRYLVGDYENDPENHGYQTDEDIRNRVNVLPQEMVTPVNYLPSPEEDDRCQDRIDTILRFMATTVEGEMAQVAFDELKDMLNDPSTRQFAIERLKEIWMDGIGDLLSVVG